MLFFCPGREGEAAEDYLIPCHHARGVASLVLAPLQAGRQESQLIGQELALFVSFGPCQLAGMPERCKKFTGYIEP